MPYIYTAINKIDNSMYIGATSKDDINDRIKEHLYDAKTKRYNSMFHNAIRKYGWDYFFFNFCEVKTTEDAFKLEKILIKEYKSCGFKLYNMNEGGYGAVGLNVKDIKGKRFGRLVVLEDTKERTKNGIVIWKCLCDCGNILETRSTLLTSGATKSCGCYLKNKISKKYIINYPDGKEEVIINLKDFCKLNNLSSDCMYAVLVGRTKQHKGFTCKKL